MHAQQPIITDEELDLALNGPGPERPRVPWVRNVAAAGAAGLPLDELCKLAAEELPEGPLATIHALVEGLRLRHIDDDVATSALAAIQWYHLPNLLDLANPPPEPR